MRDADASARESRAHSLSDEFLGTAEQQNNHQSSESQAIVSASSQTSKAAWKAPTRVLAFFGSATPFGGTQSEASWVQLIVLSHLHPRFSDASLLDDCSTKSQKLTSFLGADESTKGQSLILSGLGVLSGGLAVGLGSTSGGRGRRSGGSGRGGGRLGLSSGSRGGRGGRSGIGGHDV